VPTMTEAPSVAKPPFAAVVDRQKPLAVAILAAGESRRMGSPKALLPFRGKTFVEHLLEVTRHPRVGFTRVVLGAGAEAIRSQLQLDAVTMVMNPAWPMGQLSSIHAAIRSLPECGSGGIVLCPVDNPIVSAALVAQLIEKFDSSASQIVLPVFRGRRGHPAIFRASLYQEMLDASLDVGARQVVWAHAAELVEVETEEKGVISNLNDAEALRDVLAELN
jgi:molybdenum cofactor cytidylyltransferase